MEEDSSQSGSSNLRGAIVLTAALISISHSIRVFGAKWQLIRARLEELGAGLRAAEAWHAEMDATVVEILATLYECDELARRCLEASYSGKLLMQSDLDVAASKLDRHGKRLSGVVKGRSFGGRVDAIVVSRPGVGACKDDMRFYVNDLMTRLKVGDKAMRKQALVALREAVAAEEDGARYVKVLVEVNGVLTVLVNCLDSSEVEIQEECAKVLSFVAGFRFCICGLVSSGIIAPLIRVVEGGSEAAKEASAKCLMKLTANMDNAWAVSAHNGVSVLMGVCQNSSSGGELIGLACGVLKNLVGVDEIKRFMIERGAIAVLIRLCRSREEASQIGSIELLQALADGDEATGQVVVAEGGIRALVRATEPKSSSSLKCREVAIRAIDKLCFSSASATSLLLSYGYMDQLLYFLRNGEVSIQELALKSVYRLSKTSDEARKAMGEVGFMPHVIKFLNAKSSEVQEMAAEALQMIVSVPKNLKRFAHDSHNIGLIMQLLDPDESHNPGNRKFLLSILTAITSCNSGRRKIVNSGYVKNIEKLAQAEVTDAKRIVRKLSTNRFRSILTGIWHS
uniref:Vacuolar protein 8 n=1 Tax=Kalanchoe fedtschenkoi TaxID=63787 RepID=A0A7N0RF46_KALFE